MTWSESDSQLFLDQGRTFVPERELQIETICDLIPALEGPGHIMELCCGEGLLTRALLDHLVRPVMYSSPCRCLCRGLRWARKEPAVPS
jgi:hypothetical protein